MYVKPMRYLPHTDICARHTIEELQSGYQALGWSRAVAHHLLGFSNTRTPSPPWTHVVRTLVPLSCCDEAAIYLIKALGGEDVARDIVGGIKWWQVRGVNGYVMVLLFGLWILILKSAQHRRSMDDCEKRLGRRSAKAQTRSREGERSPTVSTVSRHSARS